MQPLACAAPNLETGIQPLRIFDHGAIKVGHTGFEAMRHRKFVGVHEQLVRQRRSDFNKLETAKFVEVLHLRSERLPVFDKTVTWLSRKKVVLKQSVYR